MGKCWGKLLVVTVFVAVAIAGLLFFRSGSKRGMPQQGTVPIPPHEATTKIASQPLLPTRVERWQQFSGDDISDFTNRFEKRFKPEIARWCKVYAGRLPFNESDITPDKFHSKVGGFVYTFMIGDTTFSIYDGPEGTRVFYLMTRQAAQQLNSVPSGGIQHEISTPVTRQVITGLLKADSGIDFPTDQISIHPTGTFSSMPGGVMVEAGGITGNNVFRIMTRTNLDFVLDGNGNLVSYQH